MHRYGTVALHRPLGLQPALFLDHLPRADGGTVRDYADVLTIEQFGALMPIGTHQAGSERGVYIGRTLAGGARPVRFDVTEATPDGAAAVDPARRHARVREDDRRRAARVAGRAARLAGRRRRPQARPQPRGLPELDGRVHVIELSGDDRYRGLLDPLVVAPEGLREDLASSYLIELLPQAPAAWETQVRKAVRAALESLVAELPARARAADVVHGSRMRAPRARRCRCGPTPASRGSASATANAPASPPSGR